MALDRTAPGLILSPHPDDAVLSAFSLLTGPGEVDVVNVCTALPAPGTLGSFDPLFGVDDSHDLMKRRLAEDAVALASVGRSAQHLGLIDDQYRDQPFAVDALAPLLEERIGGARWLAVPAGIGAHPDHVGVRDVGIEVARRARVDVVLYADLPYAIWMGWPSWVTGVPSRPFLVPDATWAAALSTVALVSGDEDLVRRPVALDAVQAERKYRTLECYETQFAALNVGPLERLRNPEILGFEAYWDLLSLTLW
jgi:LmbE family N-acetylglucosaminyl deacetylase